MSLAFSNNLEEKVQADLDEYLETYVQEVEQQMEKEQEEQQLGESNMEEAFSVFIKSLTGSKLKLQISKYDSILDLKQLLEECLETCFITSYEFKVKGKTLGDFYSLSDYPELKDGVEIHMHALPYDNKSARDHFHRLKELLYCKIDDFYISTCLVHSATKTNQHSFPSFISSVNSEPYNDLGNALNCDLQFLQLEGQTLPSRNDTSTTTTTTTTTTGETKKKKKKKVSTASSKIDRVELKTVVMDDENGATATSATAGAATTTTEGNSDEKKPTLTKISVVELPQTPEEFNSKNLFDADSFKIDSLEPLLMISNTELPKCVKGITFSAWNPVPEHRKLKGDLFYLQLETLESTVYHLTATPSGFYVNATKGVKFNPLPSNKPHKNQTLLGLICDLSPLFRSTFTKLLNCRIKKHPFEVTPVPFTVNKWINIEERHDYDPNRAEESFFNILGSDPRIQQREWNEEYQNCKELPSGTMDERVVRDRNLFRVHCDFTNAVGWGAKAIVDKLVSPINPTDKKASHVYIQNNIFFSFAINTDEPKDENDMDQYAYENANNDLKGVIAFNEADVPGVHTLASAIVDYRGHRVVAQSIIPGILQGDQVSKHVYGSIDEGKSFVTDPKYHSLLKEASEKLHIKEHVIVDESGKEHTILCPSECKGIVGSDGRFYVLDLISITPRDTNFLENKIAVFRPELIQSYVTSQRKQKEQGEETKKEETKMDESPVIAFNTDLHSITKLGGSQEVIEQDIQEVQKLGKFLIEFLLPKFVQSFKIREENPFDGRSLTNAMHERGINMRYLGKIAELAKEQSVPHLIMMCKQEMITRAAKHIYNKYLRSVEDCNLATFISRFLNCFFGTKVDEVTNKKDKKALEDTDITQATLLSLIKQSVKTHYRFELEDDFMSKFKTMATVRSFSMKVGLQILLKDYSFNVVANPPFTQNDILSLEPVIKHSTPRSKTAHNLLDVGRQQLIKGNFEMAFEFLSQAAIMFQQVKGPTNNEVATCFSFLATILFNGSDLAQSFLHQHNALLISRRVMGLDSPTICQIHSLLGLLCFNVGQAEFALKHFLRARYIHILCCGFDHPDLAHIVLNIAMMYQDMGDMQRSLKYMHESFRIYNATLGENSDQSAAILHAIAMIYNFLRQYKNAATFERRNYLILKEKYGENYPKTLESEQWVEHFTGRAVAVERELKQGEQEAMKLWNLQQSMGNGQSFTKKPPVEILNLLKEDQQKLFNLINPPSTTPTPSSTPSSTTSSTTASKKKSK